MAEELLLSKDRLLAAARRLSAPERVDLFLALRDELRGDGADVADASARAEVELSPDQLAALDRRMAQHAADPGAAIPWEQVERELQDRFGD
jgi:putative addiction module component (TIGR02574 family)